MELTYNSPILADFVDDRGNSFSERLEAKLTDIQQVGTNSETLVKVTYMKFTLFIMFCVFFYANI